MKPVTVPNMRGIKARQIAVCLTIALFLMLPMIYTAATGGLPLRNFALKGVIFFLTVWSVTDLLSWLSLKKRRLALAAAALFILFIFIPAWVDAVLIHFTGEEFTPAFFYHINPESTLIAVHTYTGFPLSLAVLMILSYFILYSYLRSFSKSTRSVKRRHMILSLAVVLISLPGTPLWALCRGAWHYYFVQEVKINVTENDRKVLSDINMHLLSKGKDDIAAALPSAPENLILIFLESMNFEFVNNPDYPDLTPSLNRYSKRFTLLADHVSTENATLPAMI